MTAVLNLDSSGFTSGIEDAEDGMGSLQDRAASTVKSMQRAGGAMTAGVTAPLAAMGAMSVRLAGNFDQAMQRSIAVMGDVDGAMKERLEATAREVANTTTHSASAAADSYYFLASAGLDAAEAMGSDAPSRRLRRGGPIENGRGDRRRDQRDERLRLRGRRNGLGNRYAHRCHAKS